MAMVAYVYLQKASPELIAGIMDFEVMMGMGETGGVATDNKGWRELI